MFTLDFNFFRRLILSYRLWRILPKSVSEMILDDEDADESTRYLNSKASLLLKKTLYRYYISV
jgi:hypothetical protein